MVYQILLLLVKIIITSNKKYLQNIIEIALFWMSYLVVDSSFAVAVVVVAGLVIPVSDW